MNKLIRANLFRLFKNFFFKICILFSAVLGIFMNVMRYIDVKKNFETLILDPEYPEYASAESFVFSGAIYIIFAAAAFVSLFLGTDYSEGTVRNKIVAGHHRFTIYLVNFITCAFANIVLLLLFIFVTLGLGAFLFSSKYFALPQIIIFTLSQCLSMIAFSAILSFIAMLTQNKAAGAVTALIITMLAFFTALTIAKRLDAPEYYESYSVSSVNPETGDAKIDTAMVKNPRYITGIKRKIYTQLDNILPVNQIYQIMLNKEENIAVMALYSALLVIIFNGGGIILFQKKDLK